MCDACSGGFRAVAYSPHPVLGSAEEKTFKKVGQILVEMGKSSPLACFHHFRSFHSQDSTNNSSSTQGLPRSSGVMEDVGVLLLLSVNNIVGQNHGDVAVFPLQW